MGNRKYLSDYQIVIVKIIHLAADARVVGENTQRQQMNLEHQKRQNMENKYDRFFESVKGFVLKTHLAYPEDLIGLKDWKVQTLSEKYNVSFPESLYSYYTFFGEKVKIIGTDDQLNLTEKKLNSFKEDAIEKNVYNGIKGVVEREYKIDEQIVLSELIDLDKVLIIGHIDYNGIYSIIECVAENPVLHLIRWYCEFDENNIDTYYYKYQPMNWSFIGFFRQCLFEAISLKFYDRDIVGIHEHELEVYDRIKFDKVEWVKYYFEHRKKYNKYNVGNGDGQEFYEIKQEFSKKMDDQAEETGIVMTVDEFEWAFLDYLRGLGVDI